MLVARGAEALKSLQGMWGRAQVDQLAELIPAMSFRSVRATQRLVRKNQPSVVVIGHGFADQPFFGDELIQAIRAACPSCLVICINGGLFLTAVHSQVDFRIKGSPENLRTTLLAIRAR